MGGIGWDPVIDDSMDIQDPRPYLPALVREKYPGLTNAEVERRAGVIKARVAKLESLKDFEAMVQANPKKVFLLLRAFFDDVCREMDAVEWNPKPVSEGLTHTLADKQG